jgi:hypothetical protein
LFPGPEAYVPQVVAAISQHFPGRRATGYASP